MTARPAEDAATTLADNTWTAPRPTRTPLPLANDTRDGCAYYLRGDDWQQDISGTNFPSNCHYAAKVLGVELVDLQVWNPSKCPYLTRLDSYAVLNHPRSWGVDRVRL